MHDGTRDDARGAAVALLTPTGRDAAIARDVLTRAGFAVVIYPDMGALSAAIGDQVGAVLLAEEALGSVARGQLLAALEAQPSWSSVPVVVLTGEGELSRSVPPSLQQLSTRANVTLLERPVRVATLVTTLRSALHARRRQFDIRDHLEQKRADEQALRESESRLRDAVLFSPYPMMLYAEDGEVLQLSRAWTALTGYPAADLRTTSEWARLGHPDGDAVSEAIRAEFVGPERAPGALIPAGERTVRTAAGEERTWDMHTVALARLPDGRRLHLTAAMDVTAYRQVVERERAARREAEAANQAKAEFLAMMSHELRTPLNAISGYTELLSLGVRGPVTDAQRDDLQRIDRNQRHLLSLINDILNFARIEAGHIAFDLRPVALRDVLQSVEPLVAPQLRAKALCYTDASGGCDAVVLADPEKARQILLNLLSNAIKFTPAGGTIALECTTDAQAALITVTDTGIGIPPDKLAAIFEPFVQVERHFASAHEGTGLGLSISRDLARRMGGDLGVRSTLGKGAAFTLTLPLAPAPGVAAPPREPA
jgi:PAS domain S-box-containing protein